MLKFLGIVEGVKTLNKSNKDNSKTWDEYYVGVSEPKAGGYNGEKIIHDIKLTREAMDAGMYKYYESLVGKRVEVPIFFSARAWNNNAYVDWIVSGNGKPVSIDGKPATDIKAA